MLIDPGTGRRVRLELETEISIFVGVHRLGEPSDVGLVEGESSIFSGVVGRTHNINEAASLASVLLNLMEISTFGSDHKSRGFLVHNHVVFSLNLD